MGFLPRFADFNGDGVDDLITGSYFGDSQRVRTKADGTSRHDNNGQYWGDVFIFWGNADGTFQPRELLTNALMHPTPVPFDWDKDGDFDLVTIAWSAGGAEDIEMRGGKVEEMDADFVPSSQVVWMENVGTKTEPEFSHPQNILESETIKNEYGEFNENYACALPVDWNDDGLIDIVIGGYGWGSLYYYENIGTETEAKFGERVTLKQGLESDGGKECPTTEEIPWGNSLQLIVIDWDGDGVKDIVAGDNASFYKPNPDFTDEQLAEVKEAQKRVDAFFARVEALNKEHGVSKMSKEEQKAYYASGNTAFAIAQKEFPTNREDQSLIYKAKVREGHGRVWFFKGSYK